AGIGPFGGGVERAHRRAPDIGHGAVTLDERDDGMVGHTQLAVLDGDLVARGDLDLACHETSFQVAWAALSAEPALNHAICSRVRLCFTWISSTRPSDFLIRTFTG